MSHQTEAFEGKLAVVGLGYVGLPLAVAFSEIMDVIGMERFNSFCREMGYQNVRRMGTPEEAFGPTAGRQG